jgi:hypothetical protein
MSEIARDCDWKCHEAHEAAISNGLLYQVTWANIQSLKRPTLVSGILKNAKIVATAFGTGLLQHKIWSKEGNLECFLEILKPIGQTL